MRITLQGSESHFDRIAEEMWAMMNEAMPLPVGFAGDWRHSRTGHCWRPALNLYETPDRYFVCVELAGVERDALDIRFEDGVLDIRGTREKPEHPDMQREVSVLLMEIDWGHFHRTVALPTAVVTSRIAAWYRQGFAWILLPKQRPESP